MAVVGIGIDIGETTRFNRVTAWRTFRELVYTEGETARRPSDKQAVDYFAVLFSLKEALLKASGLGIARTTLLRNIDVHLASHRHVEIAVSRTLLTHLDRIGCTQIIASYDLVTGRQVIANVLLLSNPNSVLSKHHRG